MSAKATLRKPVPEDRPRCPACGREAVGLATGQCIFCLSPMGAGGSRVEPAKILQLSEFDRARKMARRPRHRTAMRRTRRLVIWVALGLGLIALFEVCARWMAGFFERGWVPIG
jgi:hypothetical protein